MKNRIVIPTPAARRRLGWTPDDPCESETKRREREIARCSLDPVYFIRHYVQIEDPQIQRWFPFDLWPEQESAAKTILENQKTIALKARQLGLTWLAIGLAVWFMNFRPGSAVALTSRRDAEAVYLLCDRLKPVHERLPEWLRSAVGEENNDHVFRLANGSVCRAFATGRGDSYTNTFVVVDEADLIDDLEKVLSAMEATIDAGGQILLISKVRKSKPKSYFKALFRAAERRENGWASIFLSWKVRPERTQEWYDNLVAGAMATAGNLDMVWENYPETPAQALAPLSSDKRIAFTYIQACFKEWQAIEAKLLSAAIKAHNAGPDGKGLPETRQIALTWKGLRVYKLPEAGHRYVIGADPAEGNPTSDPSALKVIDRETWEEVATLASQLEPEAFGKAIHEIALFYNRASVLVERNNHGHAVLLWLKQNSPITRLRGEDKRPGHHSSTKGKTIMYDATASAFIENDILIHDSETAIQLASIVGTTLRAPEGEHDDLADATALAIVAATRPEADIS